MIPFTKLHGLGNDFIVTEARYLEKSLNKYQLAISICDRHRGVGGDGLILLHLDDLNSLRMEILNADGSASEMCGNGIRCLAKYIQARDLSSDSSLVITTGAGPLITTFIGDAVRVDMGPAIFTAELIPILDAGSEQFLNQPLEGFRASAVSMGNPHLVIFVEDSAAINLSEWGPKLERHQLFPNRTNVHFANVVNRNTLVQHTWERGVGITEACGTGACAVAVIANQLDLADPQVLVKLPGGSLEIDCSDLEHVLMTGPAELVFTGIWNA